MAGHIHRLRCALSLCVLSSVFLAGPAKAATTWNGVVRNDSGTPLSGAVVKLHSPTGRLDYSAPTSPDGGFAFADIFAGDYVLSVNENGKMWLATELIDIKDGERLSAGLKILPDQDKLLVVGGNGNPLAWASGGENLSSKQVSSLPLNERDFGKLLLLAAGTMTDTNGTANFTQQYAVNGQRATTTVFATDGIDSTDPEMGGAAFANYNVDAIQEVNQSSGVLPASIGEGAASYTDVITKSGTNRLHGSAFEFVRNAVFDARNFFDRKNVADERRIPPFVRNEFGFTVGGPMAVPGVYNGRNRTFFYGEYAGFRQVLGTTQVLAVPTAAERQGIDTTAFPGDTLTVPVNPNIEPVLKAYPLPNDPEGPFGARTYATSSKVYTGSDQFSVRVDHRISDNSSLYTRFSFDQITGPLTNPNQTAINPSFAIQYFNHERNAGLKYTRVWSPNLTSVTNLGYIRATPFYPSLNHTQPGIQFGDGLYQPYNLADGSVEGWIGNAYQFQQDFTDTHGAHTFQWGAQAIINRDSDVWGTNPNGMYEFGGGPAYSPVAVTSASGKHNLQPADPLPDSLTGLLTATPYSYTVSAIPRFTPGGNRYNVAAVRRQLYGFYFQDAWKATHRLTINYGLRYEIHSPIKEASKRTSLPRTVGPNGSNVPFWTPGAKEIFVENPQPPYPTALDDLGPRLEIDYRLTDRTVLHAGGAITTMITNLWADNDLTGDIPFMLTPYVFAQPGVAVPFSDSVVPLALPSAYTPDGQVIPPGGNPAKVPPNTQIDIQRLENDLAALTPGHEVQLLPTAGLASNFRDGHIGTYTAGIEHDFGQLNLTINYVATAAVDLHDSAFPNGYNGASPGFAPFTQFNSAGQPVGGYGSETLISSGSHSTYQSLQAGIAKNSARFGLGFQASYTYSKALDGGSSTLAMPQDPWNPGADKGPANFDATHVFAFSLIQALPLNRVGFLRPMGKRFTEGWQFLNITTLMTGLPFTVVSGIQQTGAGSAGVDRPDQIGNPIFSTSRTVREDYFGEGANNASLFYIPVNVAGGTGPNHGAFGTLGRNTFRGPAYRDFDLAVIKDTPFGRRGREELGILQFRAEFFNIFNLVNFGLPSNIVRGSGFGIINSTAGTSRQIQFSLRLIF